ncbi:hypothetical protein LL364_001469 [Citrobacter freundii]|nr:hypothetical protein [Citrobacter freundii]
MPHGLAGYPKISIEWHNTGRHLNIIDEQTDIVEKMGKPKNRQDLQHNYPLSALTNSNSGRVWLWQFADGNSSVLFAKW